MGNYAQQPQNKMVGGVTPTPQIQKEQASPTGMFSSALASATPTPAPSTINQAFDVNRGDPNKRVAAAWQVVDTSAADKAKADADAKAKADAEAQSKASAAAKVASEQAAANAAMQSGFWQQYEINKQAKAEAAYAAQNVPNQPPPVASPTPDNNYGETDPYEIWKAGGRQGPRPEGY